MKKFLFLTGMILAMGAFQSLKAQTFSRVVTVTLDTIIRGNSNGLNQILYVVPNNKVFKLSNIFLESYMYSSGLYYLNSLIKINSITVASYNSLKTINPECWLKSGDIISIDGTGSTMSDYTFKIFLSGIEYDIP